MTAYTNEVAIKQKTMEKNKKDAFLFSPRETIVRGTYQRPALHDLLSQLCITLYGKCSVEAIQ
jgi:hypothetical protein